MRQEKKIQKGMERKKIAFDIIEIRLKIFKLRNDFLNPIEQERKDSFNKVISLVDRD